MSVCWVSVSSLRAWGSLGTTEVPLPAGSQACSPFYPQPASVTLMEQCQGHHVIRRLDSACARRMCRGNAVTCVGLVSPGSATPTLGAAGVSGAKACGQRMDHGAWWWGPTLNRASCRL